VDEIGIEPRKRRCDARCEMSCSIRSYRPYPAYVDAVVSLVVVAVFTSVGDDHRHPVAAVDEPLSELADVCFDTGPSVVDIGE
jgi:hypothetical protein